MLAPLFITLLCALALARADSSDTHVTCDASIAQDASFAWWNNKHDQNPCVVLQNLLRQCDPDHTIHKMPGSPVHAPDICEHSSAKKKPASTSSKSSSSSKASKSATSSSKSSSSSKSTPASKSTTSKSKRGDATTTGAASKSSITSPASANSTATASSSTADDDNDAPDGSDTDTDLFIPCCCNTAAYALREACWSCQQGRKEPAAGDRRPTFREYLQCPKPAPSHIYKNASVPRWALIPVDIDAQWSFDDTAKAAKQLDDEGHSMMMDSGSGAGAGGPGLAQSATSAAAASAASASAAASAESMRMIAAIVGGVLGALVFVVLALTALICTQRRRRRAARPSSAARCPFRRGPCAPVETDEKPLLSPPVGVAPARPRPALKAARVLGATASWRSSLARLPEPVDGEPYFDALREHDAPYSPRAFAQPMSYAGETEPGTPEPYSPFALTTPSMLEARRTIPSFSATHSFAV